MKTIKKLTFVGLTFVGIAIPTVYSAVYAQGNTFNGTVERVWSDVIVHFPPPKKNQKWKPNNSHSSDLMYAMNHGSL